MGIELSGGREFEGASTDAGQTEREVCNRRRNPEYIHPSLISVHEYDGKLEFLN